MTYSSLSSWEGISWTHYFALGELTGMSGKVHGLTAAIILAACTVFEGKSCSW